MADNSSSINNENNYKVHIHKRNYETSKQFEFRKRLYDKIFNDTKDQEKSVIYSNIWVNILSLGCTYPDELMQKIEKYQPCEEDNVYK